MTTHQNTTPALDGKYIDHYKDGTVSARGFYRNGTRQG
jgi:hypothetical protein